MFFKNFYNNNIKNLKLSQRRIILLLFDSTLIIFSNWLTYNLLNKSLIFNFDSRIFFNSFLLCFVGLPIYLFTGQYKGLTRYVGSKYLYYLSLRNFSLALINFFIQILFLEESLEIIFSFSLIFWVLLTSLSGFFRFGVRDFLLNFKIQAKT